MGYEDKTLECVECGANFTFTASEQEFFASKGFEVVACPWRNAKVALGELANIRAVRAGKDKAVAARGLGMVQTTWCGFAPFLKAYQAQLAGKPPTKGAPAESARCFRTLCKAVREGK